MAHVYIPYCDCDDCLNPVPLRLESMGSTAPAQQLEPRVSGGATRKALAHYRAGWRGERLRARQRKAAASVSGR